MSVATHGSAHLRGGQVSRPGRVTALECPATMVVRLAYVPPAG